MCVYNKQTKTFYCEHIQTELRSDLIKVSEILRALTYNGSTICFALSSCGIWPLTYIMVFFCRLGTIINDDCQDSGNTMLLQSIPSAETAFSANIPKHCLPSPSQTFHLAAFGVIQVLVDYWLIIIEI